MEDVEEGSCGLKGPFCFPRREGELSVKSIIRAGRAGRARACRMSNSDKSQEARVYIVLMFDSLIRKLELLAAGLVRDGRSQGKGGGKGRREGKGEREARDNISNSLPRLSP